MSEPAGAALISKWRTLAKRSFLARNRPSNLARNMGRTPVLSLGDEQRMTASAPHEFVLAYASRHER
jgi:hypothetical protein